jgi:hypothetical protein
MTGTMTGARTLPQARERSRNARERRPPYPQITTRSRRERTGTGTTGTERPPLIGAFPFRRRVTYA